MTRFRKREKIDFRKFINRFQRVRKFCRMHSLPVLVAVGIMVSVIFTSYQNAYATGLEEYFYYTYFDLISGLFAETGMDFGLKDDYYTKSDRVSGKQVWNNFCTWVENKAKTLALPVEVVNKTVFDELKDLPNKVTSAGASMSEKLSELLAKILPTFASDTSKPVFDRSSVDSVNDFIKSVSGCYNTSLAEAVYSGKCRLYVLSGIRSGKTGRIAFGVLSDTSFPLFITYDKSSGLYSPAYNYNGRLITVGSCGNFCCSDGTVVDDVSVEFWESAPSFIINDGCWAGSDGTTLTDYAKVKTVDDNTVYVPGVGYKTNWDIWKDIVNDKATTDAEEDAWNTRYNLDNDNKDDKEKKKKDNERDKLPVAIPIIPFKKPDSTEKDTEKDTEKGTESDVPGKDPNPSKNPMINPDTGHYIDPDTGYDIDPDTGKLIDPDTGELIDPNIPSTADKAGNWKRLFPFCIPWDMMELIKSMQADKKAPVFEFKYTFKAVNYTWVVKVDMADYWKYIKIFRWGMTIFFIIGLFFLTVKFTTFVQRMGG